MLRVRPIPGVLCTAAVIPPPACFSSPEPRGNCLKPSHPSVTQLPEGWCCPASLRRKKELKKKHQKAHSNNQNPALLSHKARMFHLPRAGQNLRIQHPDLKVQPRPRLPPSLGFRLFLLLPSPGTPKTTREGGARPHRKRTLTESEPADPRSSYSRAGDAPLTSLLGWNPEIPWF